MTVSAGSAGSAGPPVGGFARRLSERLTGFAYQLGWKVICRLPQSWARWAFAEAADIAWRRQGPKVQVLEANLHRLLSYRDHSPDVDGQELRALSSQVLQSYARYWLETFRLPVIPVARIMSGMHVNAEGEAELFANLKAGRGVIIALPHMGNFEQAGAWVINRGAGSFTTVAERLRPESVYEAFVRFREGLGMEVLPLTGGRSPFGILAQRLRAWQAGLPGQRPRSDGKRGSGRVFRRAGADRRRPGRARDPDRRGADARGHLVRGG